MRFSTKLSSMLSVIVLALGAASPPAAAIGATTTGAVTLKINGTVKSPTASGASQAICTLTVTTDDPFMQTETAVQNASISKGKFTCTMIVDYSWHLKNSSSSLVTASYLVELVDGGNASVPRTSGALAAAPFAARSGGVTATLNADVTL
jgi:hypothetical protein